ncbi:hypothetical protein CD790_33470 [Streptomyces sp. SAJ15]|nr:hypothetical protein CD790_33470 [Streptomyces sp. SAJ15]
MRRLLAAYIRACTVPDAQAGSPLASARDQWFLRDSGDEAQFDRPPSQRSESATRRTREAGVAHGGLGRRVRRPSPWITREESGSEP